MSQRAHRCHDRSVKGIEPVESEDHGWVIDRDEIKTQTSCDSHRALFLVKVHVFLTVVINVRLDTSMRCELCTCLDYK